MEHDIEEVDNKLSHLALDIAIATEEEKELNEKIDALRKQLYQVQRKRNEFKARHRVLEKDRESAVRLAELKKEQEENERKLQLIREEAEKLVADAPWWNGSLPNNIRIFDWQFEDAIKLASAKRGILANPRGMGKTVGAVAWRRLVKSRRTLVLLRKQIASEFFKELKFWEPNLLVIPFWGMNAEDRKFWIKQLQGPQEQEFVIIANLEMWRRDPDSVIPDIKKLNYDAVILDEAHRVKEKNTATTQGYFRLINEVEPVLQMTGTPIRNRPQELWTLLHAVSPSLFPDEGAYKRDYCEPARDPETHEIIPNRWRFKPGGLQRLMKQMDTFFVARTPAEVGHQIPAPKIHPYNLDFDGYPKQAEIYKFLSDRALAFIDSDTVVPMSTQLEVMLRLSQVLSWPAGIEFKERDLEGNITKIHRFDVHQSVKMDWAEDFIDDLGERCLLFGRFVAQLEELADRLRKRGLRVGLVTGKTDPREVNRIKKDYDLKTAGEEPLYDCVLATYGTISESVNMNAAQHVILYDRLWNPGEDDQAIGRIDRINSLQQAQVHIPMVDNSMDTFMDELIKFKAHLNSSFKSAYEMQRDLVANLKKGAK